MSDHLLTAQQGDSAFVKLMSSPVSAPRKRMRRAKVAEISEVSSATESLADMWRKSPKGKSAPKKNCLNTPPPAYAVWLRSFLNPADVRRENERAKAEWSGIHSHPFLAAVIQGEWPAAERTRRAVGNYIQRAIPASVLRRVTRGRRVAFLNWTQSTLPKALAVSSQSALRLPKFSTGQDNLRRQHEPYQ